MGGINPAAVRSTANGDTEYDAPAKASGSGQVESIDIERAANGAYIARCREKQGGGDAPYKSPEPSAFSSFPELVSYLSDKFGEAPKAPESDVVTEQPETATPGA